METKKLSENATFLEYCVCIRRMESYRHSVDLYCEQDVIRQEIHDRLLAEFGKDRNDEAFARYLALEVEMTLGDPPPVSP